MSQAPAIENRAQRRARERGEKKAAKRLAGINPDAKPASTQSVPTINTNNKKKSKKATAPSAKTANGAVAPQNGKPAVNGVVRASPCSLIMVESAAAPSVAVAVAFSQVTKKPVTATRRETTPITKSVDQTSVPSTQPPKQADPTSKREKATATATAAASSGNVPVAQKEVKKEKGSVADEAVSVGQTDAAGSNADQQHSATTVEDKQQLQPTPASEQEKESPKPTPSDSNQTDNTLVGKDDTDKQQKQQQQPPSPKKDEKLAPTSASPQVADKKSPNLLDKFKEKSMMGAKNEPKKESKKKPWQFWKK